MLARGRLRFKCIDLAYAIPLPILFKSVMARLCASDVQLYWLFLLFRYAFNPTRLFTG
jgi:hypothetical protein